MSSSCVNDKSKGQESGHDCRRVKLDRVTSRLLGFREVKVDKTGNYKLTY